MKCQNCKNEFYPLVNDTFYDNRVKYNMYVCPVCEAENFHKAEVKPKRHWNKVKVLDNVAMLVYMVIVYNITYYVGSHLELFCTTMK